MPAYPPVTGKELLRVLRSFGFYLDRVAGSHQMMERPGHSVTVPVPVHGNQAIPRGTLSSIIRLAGLTKKEFYAAIEKL